MHQDWIENFVKTNLGPYKKSSFLVPWNHGAIVAETWREKNLYLFNVNVWKESTNMAKFLNERTTF